MIEEKTDQPKSLGPLFDAGQRSRNLQCPQAFPQMLSRCMSKKRSFALEARPGFLIRRLHQIHLSLFAEECAPFNVTPVQYSILTAVTAQPGLEQAALAQEVGIDRATL